MKTLAQLTTIGCLLTLLSSPLYGAAIEKDYSLKLTRPGEPVKLEAEIRFGSITIQGYKGETVEIKATFREIEDPELKKIMPKRNYWRDDDDKKAKPRNSDGLKRIVNNAIHLDITEDDNEVEIESEVGNRLIDLVIKVPVKTDVEAEVYAGGDIRVEGITGQVEVGNHRGGINALNINGPIVAETYQKDIVVSFQSYNTEHPSSLTTHHGNIDITIPEKTIKADLMVQSYRGEILSGLNTNFQAAEDVVRKDDNRTEITIGGAMQAKLNGGGQIMNAQTYSGNIYVRRR